MVGACLRMIYAVVFSLVVQCIDHEVYSPGRNDYSSRNTTKNRKISKFGTVLKKSILVCVQVLPRLLLPLDGLLMFEVAQGTARQHKVGRNNDSDDKDL